ncbi:hypothetical protein [Lachnoclostridium sp. An196]|uniref:hypothetical protein n=1 Tax=Lachnoclostridium sp. An196 TaxID=1965583 RepID=UPI00117BD619|nr:hypothetical protein [Lachnoclostridium sp. An196]
MNYIVTQVARPEENTVPQMQGNGITTVDKAMDVYLKNAIVSLASAKQYNPNAVCILSCNFDVPGYLRTIAERTGIQIHTVPFRKYESKEEFRWAITQYKFNAIEHVLELMDKEDCMLVLDSDTMCTKKLDELFSEAANSLILYPTAHSYSQEKRAEIRYNYQIMYHADNDNLVHYGGEFFAGNKNQMQELLNACLCVIQCAREIEDLKPWDDEHILSIAVEKFLKGYVYPANAYIFRYWTNQFYLVSTNYYYDPVCIWHLPAEKNFGMLVLYDYFVKHGYFPNVKKSAKIVGFPSIQYKAWNPYRWKMRIKNKLMK